MKPRSTMPVKKIAEFSMERLEILSPDGKADEGLMPELKEKDILELYRAMVLTRLFDSKAVSLQRQGRIRRKPVVTSAGGKEKVDIRDVLPLSLTFDHRILDGAEAALFTNDLIALLQNPKDIPT